MVKCSHRGIAWQVGDLVLFPFSQSQGEGITEKSRVHSANLEKVLE